MAKTRQKFRVNVRLVVVLLVVGLVVATSLVVGYRARSRFIAARELAAGKAAVEKREWAEACRHLRLYLEKCPDDVPMLRQYAEAHLTVRPRRPENISAALGAYRELLRHVPGDEEACHRLAGLYFAIGDYPETAYICRQRLKAVPGDPVATIWLGRSLAARRKLDEAERLLVDFTQGHPDQIEAYVLLSQMAMVDASQVSRDAALKWLDQAVANNPTSAEALARRARFHFHVRKDPVSARVDYVHAEELQPEDPRVRLMLAEGWLDMGELDRAKAQMQAVSDLPAETVTAFDINPDDLTFVELKAGAILAVRQGEKKEGVAVAERGLKELSNDRRTMFMPFAAELYLADDRTADARKCVEEYRAGVADVAKQDQAIGERLVLLDAAVDLAEGRPYEAIDLLEGLLAQKPLYPQAYRLLWFAYDRTGQRRRGVSSLEAYVARQTGDRSARLDLVRGYLSVGAQAKALQLARDMERSDPADRQAKLLRLQASLRGGTERVDGASGEALLADLRTVAKGDTCNLDARTLLATVLYARGDPAGAAAELEDTIKSCDQAMSAAMRLVELHTMTGKRSLAMQACRSAVERYPQEAEPRVVLADLLVADGKPKEAEQTLRDAMGVLAGDARAKATIALASFLTSHDRPTEGRDLLRQAAKDRPGDIDLRMALLNHVLVQQDPAEATLYVEELHKIERDHGVRWRYQQALMMLRDVGWKKRADDIVGLLRWCITADPAWAPPVLELGRAYENMNRDDLAEEVYRRYVDAYPEQLMVASRLLDLLERQRRFSESQRVLDRLPRSAPALNGHLVKVAIGQEDYATAMAELEKRLKDYPKDAPTYVLLARLTHLVRGDTPGAIKLLDQAAAIQPNLPSILSSRVAILHAAKRDDEALSLLDKESRRRHDLTTLQMRAEFLALVGQDDEAEKAFRELTTLKDSGTAGYESLARFLQQRKRVADAAVVCEEGLKKDPSNLGLNRLWARLMVLRGDPESRQKALARLDELLVRWPDDANFLTAQAAALLADKDPRSAQKATEVLERVVRLQAGFVLAHRYLIELARNRGELQKASQLAARALGANPRNVEFLLIRADLENELGNVLAARELAQSVLSIDPQSVPARNLLVRICLQAGSRAEAEKFNAEALQIDPRDEEVQTARAEILNLDNRRVEAIRVLDEYISKQPKPSPRVLLALADLCRLQGDYARAEERLNQAAATAGDSLAVLLCRLRLLAAQRSYDALINLLADHMRRHPQESSAVNSALSILISAGAKDQVHRLKPLLDQFMAANPDRTEGPLIAAAVDYAIGDFEGAEKAYRRLLRIEPTNSQGLNNLAWIVGVELKRPDEGLEIARKGVERYPADLHLLNTRGVLCYELGMMTEARKDLERCLAMPQPEPATVARTLVYLGRISMKEGDMSKARRLFEQAMGIDRRSNVFGDSERTELRSLIGAESRPATKPASSPR